MTLSRGEDTIVLAGVDDPNGPRDQKTPEALLGEIHAENPDAYTIVLCHRNDQLERMARLSADLVLSGHAHGGQFRIPFIGGFVAPDQGFLPAYTEGVFHEKDTDLVISRGLGNSVIPIRLLNRPELVKVTLYSKNQKQQ